MNLNYALERYIGWYKKMGKSDIYIAWRKVVELLKSQKIWREWLKLGVWDIGAKGYLPHRKVKKRLIK